MGQAVEDFVFSSEHWQARAGVARTMAEQTYEECVFNKLNTIASRYDELAVLVRQVEQEEHRARGKVPCLQTIKEDYRGFLEQGEALATPSRRGPNDR